MTSYHQLFEVNIEHNYFAGNEFTAYTISPDKKTRSGFLDLGLVVRSKNHGFVVYFESDFNGKTRSRNSILNHAHTLNFNFQITDPLFFSYTANFPSDLSNKVLCLSNFDEATKTLRISERLHESVFVSESEFKPTGDALNHFGQIEIKCDKGLKEEFQICFEAKSKL